MTTDLDASWLGGWLRAAAARPSPHFEKRPATAHIDLVVVHSISLPPGQFGGPDVTALFLGTLDCDTHPYYARLRGMRVSAHFFIRRTGEILQFVNCDQRAWHAGASSYRGRDNCNDDSIGIELEGFEGDRFEAAQYAALGALCRALKLRYPLAHIAGHEHIAPGRKFDPGAGFDWLRLHESLSDQALSFPER